MAMEMTDMEKCFVENWLMKYGIPNQILTDKRP